jgi:hypothetical protein
MFYANIAQLVEQLFRKQQVRGSSPLIGSIFGVWRSLVARLVRDQKVASSNLVTPTTFFKEMMKNGRLCKRPFFIVIFKLLPAFVKRRIFIFSIELFIIIGNKLSS